MSPIDVHHVVEGARGGPTVVLAHSLGTSMRMWDPQVPSLASGHRVVRYDARGHGRSPVPSGPFTIEDFADDLLQLLDRLDVERAHLVGLSLGGMAAMSLAADRPDRVQQPVAAVHVGAAGAQAAVDRPRTHRPSAGHGRARLLDDRALVHARVPRRPP